LPFVRGCEGAWRGHREGIEGARRGKSLFAPSMPSLYSQSILFIHKTNAYLHRVIKGIIVGKIKMS